MSDSNELTPQPTEPESQPRAPKKRARWLDWVLFGIGFVCLAIFAFQVARYYRAKPIEPTGEIMAGLEETDRIPAHPGDVEGFNVLIITMDTTRADHLGCYGHLGIQTPNIDALARSGVLFANAFTPSPSTLPGHSSIHTGLYPYHHGARANGTFVLSPESRSLAEILRDAGYATGAVISAYVLDSRFGLDQGFDTYDDDLSKGIKHGEHMFRERPAEFTNEKAFAWLDAHADSKFFLWVHYFDPHAPYLPPEPFRSRYQKQPYDGEIAYADHEIGALVRKLDELGVRDRTLIVLAGDHGEGLGEHKENTHSMLIYDATLHTPLIFSSPTLFAQGHVVREQVSNVDIVPTVLDLLGVATETQFDGVSLLRGAAERPKSIYIETVCTLVLHGWAPLFGIRHGSAKYIHAPRPEYYDLADDPKELKNLFEQRPEEVAALSTELDRHIGEDRYGEAALAQAIPMDAETTKKMAALGYVGAVTPRSVDAEAAALLDPKDMIPHWESVQKASNLIAAGKLHEGREILEACVEEVPGDVYALRNLAQVYLSLNRLDDAENMLRQALEHEKQDPTLYVVLGRTLSRRGDFAAAEELFEHARKMDPDYAGTLVALASLAAARNRFDQAEAYYRQAIEMDPGTTGPDAYVELGMMYLSLLRYDDARKAFNSAIEIEALNGFARAGLGSILAEEGKFDEAEEEFRIANRFEPGQPVFMANLAGLYDKKREYDKAKALAEQALAINDSCAPALNNLGLIMKHLGDMDKAIELFERVLDSQPAYLACRLNLAQCYLARQEEEKAAEQFEQVLRYNPAVPSALVNLGVYHFKRGRPDQALQLFQRALRADPDYALAHGHYGRMLLQSGRVREALFHLRRSLELEPDQPGYEELEHQVRVLAERLGAFASPDPTTRPASEGN